MESISANPYTSLSVSPTEETTYTLVSLSDNNGCVATELTGAAVVSVDEVLAFTVSNPSAVCGSNNETVDITTVAIVTNGVAASWKYFEDNNGSLGAKILTGADAIAVSGEYFIQGINVCGEVTKKVQVTVGLQVDADAKLTFSQSAICEDAPSVELSATPTGGTFTETAYVTEAGEFNPSGAVVGNNPVTYTVTIDGCVASKTIDVVIGARTAAEIIFDEVPVSACESAPAFTLDVTPAGGIFTETAYITEDGLFNPALATPGNNPVTYTVTVDGCKSTDVTNIVTGTVEEAEITFIQAPVCVNAPAFNLAATPAGGLFSSDFALNFELRAVNY